MAASVPALTKFPNLFADREPLSASELRNGVTSSIRRVCKGLSNDLLVTAWAWLLRSYTTEECPKFLVREGVVTVDTTNRITSHEEKATQDALSGFETEVLIVSKTNNTLKLSSGDEAIVSPCLTLTYVLQSGEIQINATALIPKDHLPELLLQLLSAVQVLKADDQQVVIEALEHSNPPRLSISNSKPARQRGPQLLHELSFHTCHPDALAIDFLKSNREKVQLSYNALKGRAKSLTNVINKLLADDVSRSIDKQQIVPLLVPQSPDLYVALLAILEAGAAFCPLSLDAPADRQAFIIKDVAAAVVVTTKSLAPKIPQSCGVKIILIDDLGNEDLVQKVETQPQPLAFNEIREDDLAYILYTSGSTGQPKGVKLSHRAVTQSLLAHDTVIPDFSRFLQFADPTFDVSMFEIFFTFFRGATLAGCDKAILLNDIVSVVNELDVDGADLTPTIAGSLLKTRENVPRLKHLLTIGEMLTSHVVSEFGRSESQPGILHGMYGPTEAAIHCTIASDFPASAKTGIIGKPLKSVSAFIAAPHDSHNPQRSFQILPIGHIGELVIGGYQLADGYLNRKEQTEAAFLNHGEYGPLYRTGDKARMLPDGNLECLGRIQSGQIKLRGQRIELGEIEQVILKTNGCRLAVASVILNNLVIFCAFDTNQTATENVMDTCKHWLPSYMLPNDVIVLQEMPRLASGKIDRKGLEVSYKANREVNSIKCDSIAPNTPAERWVVDIISFALNVELKLHTNLFRMGLDSLSAIHIASSLRKDNSHFAAGTSIAAADVLQNPTCAEIVNFLSTKLTEPEDPEPFDFDDFDKKYRSSICEQYTLRTEDVEAILPTTALQNGMISQFLRSNGKYYFNIICVEFDETYSSKDKLKSTWEDAVRKYTMLRTGFVAGEDASCPFVMIAYSDSSSRLPLVSVSSATPSTEALSQLRTQMVREISANLHQPPWRVAFIPQNDKVQMFFFAHHALFDADSLGLIIYGVKAAYRNGKFPSTMNLRPALKSILAGASDTAGQHKFYWSQMLSNASTVKFPDLAPLRVADRKSCSLGLSSSMSWDMVKSRCKALAVTFQAVLQIAWARLLSKYTGERDVTFGLVLSGRDNLETESVIFPCTTTVPCRISTSDDVEDMLKGAMTFNASVRRHQHCPLTQIQRWTGVNNSALFDTILSLQRVDSRHGSDHSWADGYAEATVEYPLSLEIYTKDNGEISLQAVFWDDVVPHAHAQLLLEQFDFFCRDTVGIPSHDGPSQMPHHLLAQLPPKTPSIPSTVSCLHQFVEYTAQKSPDKIALEYNLLDDKTLPRTWTYTALNEEGNRAANLILDLGVNPRSIVVICFDKTPDAYFGALGVLKAGSGFLAIDIGAPLARKKFIIEDSRAALVLTDHKFYKELSNISAVPVVCIDSTARNKFSASQPPTSDQADPQDTCYCLYTSGSTGTPKGCLLSHENAVQAMLAFQRLYAGSWNENSRWLQFASFHFDVSVMEQYWSWSVGICVISTPRDILFEDLPGALNKLKVTHIDLTPSLARLITPSDVPSLCKGVFITGGEALTQEVLDVWGPENVIHNGYGPTETTIGNIMYTRVPKDGKPLNIGWQFDNVGTYVFEPGTNSLVPRGAIGELCISGKLVAKGYLNRPELTQKSFIFSEKYRERLYHTKDLVRMLHDGSFQFCGRVDEQVKLRGQRLELGEVNSAIKSSSPLIQEAKTLLLTATKMQAPQLVAFVLVKSEKRLINGSYLLPRDDRVIDQIQKTCRDRLPGYMVPSQFVLLGRMPLTGNNKNDTRKLNDIFEEHLSKVSTLATPDASSAPMSSTEREVAILLAESLNISSTSILANSNIFQLGIDSINIFAFARRLQRAGFKLADPSRIMRSQAVSSIAKHLESTKSTGTDSSIKIAKQNMAACKQRYRATAAHALGTAPENIEDIVPCTPIQQGIIARSLDGSKATYFNTFLFELAETIDILRLKTAWNTLYRNIQTLRLKFAPIEDGYVQVVIKDEELPWLESTVTSDREDNTSRLKMAWLSENSEVVKSPLQIIVQNAPYNNGRRMILNVFHALYDAISLTIILDNLSREYKGLEHDLGPNFFEVLPYGPLQLLPDAEQFWMRHLKEAPFCPMPQNRVLAQEADSHVCLCVGDLGGLESIRRELSVTHQAIFQTCWSFVLQSFLGQPVTIGRVVSGRSIPYAGADRVIGPLFNTIPFYVDTGSGSETWASAIQKCHAFNNESLPYQHTSLRNILKWTRSGRTELFDTLFVFQKNKSSTTVSADMWDEVDIPPQADYPLAFEVDQQGDSRLKLTIVAQRTTASNNECRKLLNDFVAVLTTVLSDPWQMIQSSSPDFARVSKAPEETFTISDSVKSLGGKFVWSDEAKLLQSEIATLAHTAVNQVTELTSIFELGIDSIDCIKLSSRLKKKGLKVSVSTILRNPTIARILECLDLGKEGRKATPLRDKFGDLKAKLLQFNSRPSLSDHSDIADVLPLTPLQESMVAEMFASNFASYFNHDVLKLRDDLNINQLIHACQDLVAMSPILRTSFREIEDPNVDCVYAQIIHKSNTTEVNQRKIGTEQSLDVVIAEINASTQRAGTHFKPCLFTVVTASSAKYLVLSMAHSIYDGWSLNLLHADISRAYRGCLQARPYYDHVLQEIFNDSGLEAERFWKGYLSDYVSADLLRSEEPKDRENVDLQERHSTTSLLQVQQFSQKHDITLQTLGVLCWSLALASYVHKLDVVCGIVLAGRDDEEAQQVLFPTMNTLPIRTVIHGSLEEMLRYTQDNLADIRQYQHTPLRRIQGVAANQAGPLFETLFIYQIQPDANESFDALYESIRSEASIEYPVNVEMEIMRGALYWRSACKESVFSKAEVSDLLDRLDKVLTSIVLNPERQSLDFINDEVAICGLPSFKLNDRLAANDSLETSNTSLTLEDIGESREIENSIRDVLAAVAKIDSSEIPNTATIYSLGLDSISAIKVSGLLRKRGLRITVSEMMRASSVRNIARLVKSAADEIVDINVADNRQLVADYLGHIPTGALIREAGIDFSNVEDISPISSGQMHLLSNWQNNDGAVFFPNFTYVAYGEVDIHDLKAAWEGLVDGHPILRTTFVASGDPVMPIFQIVLKNQRGSFFMEDEAAKAGIFDFQEAPVAIFAKQNEKSVILNLKIHHALYDAISLPLLMKDFECLYNKTPQVTANAIKFLDFLAIDANKAAYERRKEFWTRYLQGVSSGQHLSRKSLENLTQRTECYHQGAVRNVNKIDGLLKNSEISIQALFLAMFAQTYARIMPQKQPIGSDYVIGVYLANRSRLAEGLENLAMPTLNIVPLRVKSATQPTSIIETAKQIQLDLQQIGSPVNSGVGLWEIEQWTGLRIDCFVNFLRLPDVEGQADNLNLEDARNMKNSEGLTSRISIEEVPQHYGLLSPPVTYQEGFSSSLSSFDMPQQLRGNPVLSAYPPNMDVEAAVRNGCMDIGVFGPKELVPHQMSELIVDGLTKELEALMQ